MEQDGQLIWYQQVISRRVTEDARQSTTYAGAIGKETERVGTGEHRVSGQKRGADQKARVITESSALRSANFSGTAFANCIGMSRSRWTTLPRPLTTPGIASALEHCSVPLTYEFDLSGQRSKSRGDISLRKRNVNEAVYVAWNACAFLVQQTHRG